MRQSEGIRFVALCVEAYVLMPLFAIAVRLAPGLVMTRMRQTSQRTGGRADGARAVAAAIDRAARWLPARIATCLPRACAAHVMLGRRGIASHLRIGVVKSPHGGVSAHAWVEAGGVEIGLDATSPSFVLLPVS